MVVSLLAWMLGTEFRSSLGVICTPNLRAAPPAPGPSLKKTDGSHTGLNSQEFLETVHLSRVGITYGKAEGGGKRCLEISSGPNSAKCL